MRTPEEAAQWVEAQQFFRPKGMCLRFSRTAYLVDALWSDAATAWRNTDYRESSVPPRGVPVWWTGGPKGFGHVAVSVGDGYVVSTDYPSAERASRVPISLLTRAWNLEYRGWSHDINEVRVYFPPIAPPIPSPPLSMEDDMTPDLFELGGKVYYVGLVRINNDPNRRELWWKREGEGSYVRGGGVFTTGISVKVIGGQARVLGRGGDGALWQGIFDPNAASWSFGSKGGGFS